MEAFTTKITAREAADIIAEAVAHGDYRAKTWAGPNGTYRVYVAETCKGRSVDRGYLLISADCDVQEGGLERRRAYFRDLAKNALRAAGHDID